MILRHPEDYTNWEKLIQHCETIDGLTELEKEKAKRAFVRLKEEFGDCFLEEAYSAKHPFTSYITNLAPWTRKWITWFAEAVQELKCQGNYQSLLNRLRDGRRFHEGLSVLMVAYKLSKAGFDVIIDPPVDVSGKQKIPDLRLIDRDTEQELFVEVSALRMTRSEEEAFQTAWESLRPLWNSVPSVQYCGFIHKALAKRHLDHVVERVEEALERVKEDNSFGELVIEGVIELGIAPKNSAQILDKWASERGLEVGTLSGPPLKVDEIRRIRQRMGQKQQQLPHDYPNILLIW